MMRAIRARLNVDKSQGDRGVSLIELIVAMSIFSIVLVVFMAAVASMAKVTVRSEATSDSADQMRNVFLRLDKEVRYASDINTPATSAGAIYIEYWVPASSADGTSLCVQWRDVTATDILERRTWTQGAPGTVTGWITMADNLRNNLSSSAEQPFVIHRAGTSDGKVYLHQRLDVFLSAGLGTSSTDSRGSELDTTFVAQNSSTTSITNPGTTNVCLTGSVQRP